MYSARDSLKDEFVCEVDTAIGTSVHLEYQNVHEKLPRLQTQRELLVSLHDS